MGGAQWEHYRKTIGWNDFALSLGDKVIIGWSLWAVSLMLFLPALALAELAARLGWRRLGRFVWFVAALLVVFWLLADLQVQATTGNHLSHYVQFLSDPASWQFGGGIGFVVRQAILGLGAVVLAILALDWLCRKQARWLSRRWNWLGRGAGTVVCLTVLVGASMGAAAAQSLMSCPLALERLCATLPYKPPGWLLAPAGHGELDQFRLALSERHRSGVRAH